jgi:hypothetical protein
MTDQVKKTFAVDAVHDTKPADGFTPVMDEDTPF